MASHYKTLRLDAARPEDVAQAAEILRNGGLVAFATETVYGLGANALSAEAVAGIFTAKERPSWDPLIVHVPERIHMHSMASLPQERSRVLRLTRAFWPGPLTLLLPRREGIPDAVTAGRPLVGVRVPALPVARELIRLAGVPIAAPSANRFGHTSPSTAQHVLDDLDGRIDAVLDAGPCTVGVESTVVDPSTTPMTVYRPGGVTVEQLEQAARAPARLFVPESAGNAAPEALPSPGVGIRHYAPRARLHLVEKPERWERTLWRHSSPDTARVGVLLPTGWPDGTDLNPPPLVEAWADWDDPQALAVRLFSGLRALDDCGAELILCPLPEPGGLRDALRDRLLKAQYR